MCRIRRTYISTPYSQWLLVPLVQRNGKIIFCTISNGSSNFCVCSLSRKDCLLQIIIISPTYILISVTIKLLHFYPPVTWKQRYVSHTLSDNEDGKSAINLFIVNISVSWYYLSSWISMKIVSKWGETCSASTFGESRSRRKITIYNLIQL